MNHGRELKIAYSVVTSPNSYPRFLKNLFSFSHFKETGGFSQVDAFLLECRLHNFPFWLQLHKVTWKYPCSCNTLSGPCLFFSLFSFGYSFIYCGSPTLIKSDLLWTFLLHFSIIHRSYVCCIRKNILYLIKSFLWWLCFLKSQYTYGKQEAAKNNAGEWWTQYLFLGS